MTPETTSIYVYIQLKSELPDLALYPGPTEGSGLKPILYGWMPWAVLTP